MKKYKVGVVFSFTSNIYVLAESQQKAEEIAGKLVFFSSDMQPLEIDKSRIHDWDIDSRSKNTVLYSEEIDAFRDYQAIEAEIMLLEERELKKMKRSSRRK